MAMHDSGDIPHLRRKLQSLIELEEYERCSSLKKWIEELEEATFNKQFEYVKKVIKSCKTQEQKEVARTWSFQWAQRMRSNFPSLVDDATELFIKVTKK
jgi:hypothetical protein